MFRYTYRALKAAHTVPSMACSSQAMQSRSKGRKSLVLLANGINRCAVCVCLCAACVRAASSERRVQRGCCYSAWYGTGTAASSGSRRSSAALPAAALRLHRTVFRAVLRAVVLLVLVLVMAALPAAVRAVVVQCRQRTSHGA